MYVPKKKKVKRIEEEEPYENEERMGEEESENYGNEETEESEGW